MKNVMLIIACLMAINVQGQIDSSKIITPEDRQLASNCIPRPHNINDKRPEAIAWYKVASYTYDSTRTAENNRIGKITKDGEKGNANYERNMIKKYGKEAYDKAIAGKVWIGIPDELCLRSLNTPNRVKKNHTSNNITETWIYQGKADGCIGDCPYLDYVITFKNHKAISISEGEK